MVEITNRRILVIDDNELIHADFVKLLGARTEESESFTGAKNAFFAIDPEAPAEEESLVNSNKIFEIDSAFQGQEGFEKVKRSLEEKRPYALAFVDVRMPPGWDGIRTIKEIWRVDPDLQIVLCTAYSDYSAGEISSSLAQDGNILIIKKPFDPEEVCLTAISMTIKRKLTMENRRHMSDLETLVEKRTSEVSSTRDAIVYALAKLAESRDPETGNHLARMRIFSQIIAKDLASHGPYQSQIDDTFLYNFYRATPLHDIGKVGIPDNILLKPGLLTSSEFEIMKQHTVIGAQTLLETEGMLPSSTFLEMAAEIAIAHHEWMDGSGYPYGISGTDIPLSARIVAVADVFDALTSKRIYKEAMSVDKARAIIYSENGIHFDPAVVEAFDRRIDLIVDERDRIDGVSPERYQDVSYLKCALT